MKIYFICEYCSQIFSVTSVDGLEGAAEIEGVCDDCAMEIGLLKTPIMASHRHYYS